MSDIDLQALLNYYDTNLCNRLFRYVISNGQIVDIIFYKEQLCHLLGLQYIYNGDKHYLGAKGYQKIKSGTVTTNALIAHNKKQFNFIKDRLAHFCELSDLLKYGQLIRFYQDRVYPHTQITAEYLISKDNKAYILHLFLRKENFSEQKNLYAPISFIIKSNNDNDKQQFLDNQEFKKIVNREIISCDHI